MNFITDVFVAILTAYLAFTSTLADVILRVDSEKTNAVVIDEAGEHDSFMSSLPSRIKAIPDILLRSAEYQEATLAGAVGLSEGTTDDPMEALVNIFCTYITPEYIKTTTGTGFFIDPDGVIMTNAHVAQMLLFEQTEENGKTECVVRSGNPAAPAYYAELLYLPPAWIQENAVVLHDEVPMGTGERDYALLYVTRRVTDEPLPAVFPALNFDANLLPISLKGKGVTAAGYPAGALLRSGPSADLIPVVAETVVSELYTFGSNYADVIAIRGSAVGAEGASGGPVLDEAGNVIGIIVTRGNDETDGAGSLRAITLSHVHRTMIEETGFTLQQNLGGNLPYRAEIFGNTLAPFLLSIIEQAE